MFMYNTMSQNILILSTNFNKISEISIVLCDVHEGTTCRELMTQKLLRRHKRDSKDYDPLSGNRLLHTLTSSRNYSLRIDLGDFEGNTAYASYSHFEVGSEADGFRLTVDGYSGTAGWCLYQHLQKAPINMCPH